MTTLLLQQYIIIFYAHTVSTTIFVRALPVVRMWLCYTRHAMVINVLKMVLNEDAV